MKITGHKSFRKDINDVSNQIYYGTSGAEQFALQTLEGVENFGAHYLMANGNRRIIAGNHGASEWH